MCMSATDAARSDRFASSDLTTGAMKGGVSLLRLTVAFLEADNRWTTQQWAALSGWIAFGPPFVGFLVPTLPAPPDSSC